MFRAAALFVAILSLSPSGVFAKTKCEAALSNLKSWYPETKPFDRGYLAVSRGHRLYYEVLGNPKGKPVVFVHGGPGGGLDRSTAQLFDPAIYKIILFDQRASGRSQFDDPLSENTTHDLVADMERIRAHLKIQKWMVTGHSWGSFLGLVYAQKHPSRVTQMILGSLFVPEFPDRIYQKPQDFRSANWKRFLEILSPEERAHPVAAYYRRITGRNVGARRSAVAHWLQYSLTLLSPNSRTPRLVKDGKTLDSYWKSIALDVHYTHHGYFVAENQLIDQIENIRGIPTVIIHGDGDRMTPLRPVAKLHEHWPEARLAVIDTDEHSLSPPEFLHEFISATDEFAR